MLIERLDSFSAAPFTIQRISELLSDPRKQYSRIDKFMRAVEKNILVVSTVSPGRNREESENGDSLDSVGLNGEFSSEVNVDIDMENDGSFTMTKEFNATTHRKESNHEVTTETIQTVTVKKLPSKEEQATTSTIAINGENSEALQPTETDIKIETQTTVTITVCEENKSSVTEETIGVDKSNEEQNPQKPSEETVIKSDSQHEPITLLTEDVEPKIDDALLNEPLRPVDDEILPVNPETTPLAALENIVANRVEVVVEAPVTPRMEETIAVAKEEQLESTKVCEQVPVVSEPEPEPEKVVKTSEEIPEIDEVKAKRIKLDEVVQTEIDAAENQPEMAESPENIVLPVVEEPPTEQHEEPQSEPQSEVTEQKLEVKVTEVVSTEVSEPIEAATVAEPTTVEKDIVAAEPVIEEATAELIVTEMEPAVENTMALDEEISAVHEPVIPQTTTESEPAGNKMETDDNEAENVLMDTDETEEPMDQ